MIEPDRDRLVKILRMFSSNHDGEVVSAARRAHELLKLRALDWDDLIIGTGTNRDSRSEERTARHDVDEAILIRRCAEYESHLSTWEREFIASIADSIQEWGRLTPKQAGVLNRIVNKLKLRGAWQ